MNLLISLITHNRLAYTKKTLKYLWDTLQIPNYLLVVDNASTDGTREYLQSLEKRGRVDAIFLQDENLYPGKATNFGWTKGLELYTEATHLMRCDNDMLFETGWDYAAESYFKAIPELGQLGLDHEAIEHPKAALRALEINGMTINEWPGCVGGPNIIRRKLWDAGLRYPELRWDDGRNEPLQEDSQFSRAIKERGYLVAHMTDNLSRTFANPDNWKDYKEYYTKTMTERGYNDRLREAGL